MENALENITLPVIRDVSRKYLVQFRHKFSRKSASWRTSLLYYLDLNSATSQQLCNMYKCNARLSVRVSFAHFHFCYLFTLCILILKKDQVRAKFTRCLPRLSFPNQFFCIVSPQLYYMHAKTLKNCCESALYYYYMCSYYRSTSGYLFCTRIQNKVFLELHICCGRYMM